MNDIFSFIEGYMLEWASCNGRLEDGVVIFREEGEFNRLLEEAIQAYNSCPQDALGSLSPNEVYRGEHGA